MIGEALGMVAFVVGVGGIIDSTRSAESYLVKFGKWALGHKAKSTGTKYQHNPCRSYRVQGPERKV